jgi:transcriptional regulator with XRE-family HTH domain
VDTLQQQFGDLIRRRRKEKGLGQEALADKAGLHRTHVSLLERGKRMPSLQVVKKLAAALDTTMASLMEELERSGNIPPGEDRSVPAPSATSPKKPRKG